MFDKEAIFQSLKKQISDGFMTLDDDDKALVKYHLTEAATIACSKLPPGRRDALMRAVSNALNMF